MLSTLQLNFFSFWVIVLLTKYLRIFYFNMLGPLMGFCVFDFCVFDCGYCVSDCVYFVFCFFVFSVFDCVYFVFDCVYVVFCVFVFCFCCF